MIGKSLGLSWALSDFFRLLPNTAISMFVVLAKRLMLKGKLPLW